MRKDRLILWKGETEYHNLIYYVYIEKYELYYVATIFDEEQVKAYNISEDRDLILSNIDNPSHLENITNHHQLNQFLRERNLLSKLRDYKLNKILLNE